jgi:hypothetical protein
MEDDEAPTLSERLEALPDGTLMKHGFIGLLVLSAVMIGMDLRELVSAQTESAARVPALSPVTMPRPERHDQLRPYLPKTRPVAPGTDTSRLRERPRDESEAEPMVFRLGTHGAAFAEGTITPGTGEAFAEFLAQDRAKNITEIVLHSPGGSVNDAGAMARAIRDAGLATRVLADGYCASSCPIVFAAGVDRVADATAWIGVHQAFALDDSYGSLSDGMEQAQMVGAEVQDLLDGFGVDPLVWTRAMATPKDMLYLFTPEELIALKLATEVEGADALAGPDGA